MKWPISVTRVRISRILVCILLLGMLKISLLAGWEMQAGRPVETDLRAEPQIEGVGQALQPREALAQGAPAEAEPVPQGSLSEEWNRLRQMDRDLNRREQDLKALEQNIDRKLAQISDQQAELNRLLSLVEEVRDKKLKHLVDVYSNMKPKQAAEVLETLDEEIAVKILTGMRGRTAGEILSFVNARKAAVLSSRLTHMQIPEER